LHPALLLLLVGLLYILVFGALSHFRREGLSLRFAYEALALTLVACGLSWAGLNIPPVLFLLFLYLLTMRVRLLVDLGNFYAQRGRFPLAERIYALALWLWPDATNRLIVRVNQGTAKLQQGALEEAVAAFKEVLQEAGAGHLGIKYEAAAHYNLGLAYRRSNQELLAVGEFHQVLEVWPVSECARRAQICLKKDKQEH
jgi:tetratricopeptide (TPR) repeat protein